MRQFLLALPAEHPAAPGDVVVLDTDEARHLKTVLRVDAGAVLNLTDGQGYRYTGTLLAGPGKRVSVEILSCSHDESEGLRPRLVLAVAVVKAKRFEWAVEKACELGAHAIVPLQTEYGVIQPRSGKQKRWQTILASAVKQCGRSLIPELGEAMTLAALLESAQGPVWYGAAPGVERERQKTGLSTSPETGKRGAVPQELVVCIGPEGGWSAAELDMLAAAGAEPLYLGPHVLRTETAAAAALVVLQQWRQNFIRGSGES